MQCLGGINDRNVLGQLFVRTHRVRLLVPDVPVFFKTIHVRIRIKITRNVFVLGHKSRNQTNWVALGQQSCVCCLCRGGRSCSRGRGRRHRIGGRSCSSSGGSSGCFLLPFCVCFLFHVVGVRFQCCCCGVDATPVLIVFAAVVDYQLHVGVEGLQSIGTGIGLAIVLCVENVLLHRGHIHRVGHNLKVEGCIFRDGVQKQVIRVKGLQRFQKPQQGLGAFDGSW